MAMNACNFGMFPNMGGGYYNQVALNDISGMDLYNPYSMGGSLFGGGIGQGCGMPFTPNFTGGANNNVSFLQQYQDYMTQMTEFNVKNQQNMRNADLRLNAPQEGVQRLGVVLSEKIKADEQEQIIQAYDAFKEGVKNMYGGGTEEEVNNRAQYQYQKLFGTSLTDDLRKHGNGSFTQGLIRTGTFGFGDKFSAEDNVSVLTGQPVGKWEAAKKKAGAAVGGAALGVTAAVAAKTIFKGFLKGVKNKGFIAGIVGAAAGLIFASSAD